MADVFSEIENVFSITAVSDFCQNPIQQLPFSSNYAKQAVQQLVEFYTKLHLSDIPDKCQQMCKNILEELNNIRLQEIIEFNHLVICYDILRKAIVMLVILHNVFSSASTCSNVIEYKICLDYINNGREALGIDLGEAAIAHQPNSKL